MKLAQTYEELLNYYNEHCDNYFASEDDVKNCHGEYDKSLRTRYTYITGNTEEFKFECSHERCDDWSNKGEWIIVKVKDLNGNYLLNKKIEVKDFI